MPAQPVQPNNSTSNKKIDQVSLDNIFASSVEHSLPSLSSLLLERGFSTDISHVAIHMGANNKFDFSGCTFSDVVFSGDFRNKSFENAKFSDSHFVNANFSHSLFKHTTFEHCDFKNATFNASSYLNTTINKSLFWSTDFSHSFFSETYINNSIFTKANFHNTFDYQNKIEGMHIIFNQEYPTNYAFPNATFHAVTPKVALSEDASWYSTPYNVIKEYNNIPVSIPDSDSKINYDSLALEVKAALKSIETEGLKGISIAQHVVHSDQPIIKEIYDKAFAIMQECDALWIPGGPDLHPEFYGQQNTQSYPSYSYYREILEFSLTDAALALQKPIIGICHGSQLVNVFLGGTLHQHIDGHIDIEPALDVLTYEGPLGSALDKNQTVLAPSYHHQAVDKLADALEVVATHNNVVKATQSKDGKPIILCQFHPEQKADQNSIKILDRFNQFSTDSALKKATLQLSDVIQFDNDLFVHSSSSPDSPHLPSVLLTIPVLPEITQEVVLV